jgi:hypothetical protein
MGFYPLPGSSNGLKLSSKLLIGSKTEARTRTVMDHLSLILIFIFVVGCGINGSVIMSAFIQGILYFCDWREGADMNWSWEIFTFSAGSFAWIFAILEIVMLYSK